VSNTKPVTTVEETAAVQTVQTTLESALQTKPAAVGIKSKSDAATLLSAGQQKQIAEYTAEAFNAVLGFQQARRVEGKAVHAVIVENLGRAARLVFDVDGRKAAQAFVRGVFNPFKDVDKGNQGETHAYGTTQIFESKEVVKASVTANPMYLQYFRRWEDLTFWEAGIYREAEPKSGRNGETVPQMGIPMHGKTYQKPSEALKDEHTLSDVHQAFKNIIRPSIEVIDDLPSATAKKRLFKAGVVAADTVSVVYRQKQKVGDAERMQKVKRKAEELPDAALHGVISGLVGIAIKRGETMESLMSKITQYAGITEEQAATEV
jgi:hypothetical protein